MAKVGGKSKAISKRVSEKPNGSAAGASLPDAGSVDKIRDILFGNQMRDFERRFSLMEERMAKTTQGLRDETHKRLESLERFFKEEMGALKARLKSESDQRVEANKKQDDALSALGDSMRKTITETEESFETHTSELRQQILKQSKSLSGEIQSKYEQATQELRLTAEGLNDAKIERSKLAEYLIEMATRMSVDTAEPAAGHPKN